MKGKQQQKHDGLSSVSYLHICSMGVNHFKRIEEFMANRNEEYADVMNFIRTCLRFSSEP